MAAQHEARARWRAVLFDHQQFHGSTGTLAFFFAMNGLFVVRSSSPDLTKPPAQACEPRGRAAHDHLPSGVVADRFGTG
jgi:hypothetical protein